MRVETFELSRSCEANNGPLGLAPTPFLTFSPNDEIKNVLDRVSSGA